MTESSPVRSGFRLYDAIALLIVLMVLVGLFLPGLQTTRSRRRPQCQNHLRQLAMGIHTFVSSRTRFPGYAETLLRRESREPIRHYSWFVALSPYLEQRQLWEQWTDPQIANPAAPFVPPLWCPAAGEPDKGHPLLSYVVNVGRVDVASEAFANGVFMDRRVHNSSQDLRQLPKFNFDDIVDGTSNTLMLSENLGAGKWSDVDKTTIGFGWWKTTTPTPDMRIQGQRIRPGPPLAMPRPSSHHPGGVYAAFGDGMTRFISEQIDYRVYIQLLTTDDQGSEMPDEWKAIKVMLDDIR